MTEIRASVDRGSAGSPGRDAGRGEVERRVLLAVLAVSFTIVGGWALLAPASFHAAFPFGRSWVALDGPFNEHLVRDVGALQLAIGALAGLAVARPWLTGVVAAATLVFAVPHLAYHATHLAPFGVVDAVAQLVALTIQVLVPVRLLTTGSGPFDGPDRPGGTT